MKQFKIKKDRYRIARGGYSRFLNIFCQNCSSHILLYQKDGPGPLKRLYLDRIVAPDKLVNLHTGKAVPNLICGNCKQTIAIPGTYRKENRAVYLPLAYSITKKVTKGVYPPNV